MENNQQQQNPALKLEKSSTAKSNSNLSAGQKEKVTGLITEALPDTTFKVRLEDGKEVLALYSPARGAGVRLEDDVQFSRLMNTEFGFSFVQPRSFNQTEVIEGSLRDIVFTAATNESIVVSVQENENRLSLKDWYNELSGGKGIETQEFITKAKYSALVIPDKTAYYVALPNSPYVIVFSYTAQEEFNYFTTVRMMVESVYMTAGASM